jgi:transposase
MNNSITYREDQWIKIVAFLRTQPGVYVGRESSLRRFLEGVLWILRSGAQWRLLPTEYGNWNSVYKRFARWCEQGIWQAMHDHFAQDPDMEQIILDSTVVRAHPCAAGAQNKDGGQATQALGWSRGGFSTKIHVNVDALGNPLRFRLTAGQRHDITQAEALIADYEFERLIADTSYDADEFRQVLADKPAEAVIPSRKNRKAPRDYDHHLYKERHLVECFINKIKQYRRIFSRFDKLAQRYLGFLGLAGALIWLR